MDPSQTLPSPSELLEIDGSLLEGGGQVLRNCSALSILLGKPIHLVRIRGGREKGGLKAQHMTGVRLLADLSEAALDGCTIGSTELTLRPGPLRGGSFQADTHTAGSITLLLQAALPAMLFSPASCHVVLKGGTNVSMSPPIDYVRLVLSQVLQRFGIEFRLVVETRGFFPRGGGTVIIDTEPCRILRPIDLTDQGTVASVRGLVFWAASVDSNKQRGQNGPQVLVDSATRRALQLFGPQVPIAVDLVREPPHRAVGTGWGIVLYATTSTGCVLGADVLGEGKLQPERAGVEAVESLFADVRAGACVDQHMQDQVILFMALAQGRSRVRTGPLSLHTQTALHFVSVMTSAKFAVVPTSDGGAIIECEGIGYTGRGGVTAPPPQ